MALHHHDGACSERGLHMAHHPCISLCTLPRAVRCSRLPCRLFCNDCVLVVEGDCLPVDARDVELQALCAQCGAALDC